jgi:hypothetical protein
MEGVDHCNHIYINDDKTDTSNYAGMSVLPTIYRNFSSILLSRLTSYVDEINGDHLHRFDERDKLLIKYSEFKKYCKKLNTIWYNISYLWISRMSVAEPT